MAEPRRERGKGKTRPTRGRATRSPGGRVYAGKLPLERRTERRRQILEAAHDLFGTRGYLDTSIEQVCASAGVGIRAMYEEFGGREELFRQVFDNIIERAYAAVERVLEANAGEPPIVLLSEGLRAYLHAMLDDPRCGRIVSVEVSALDPVMGRHRNRTLKRFAALAVTFLPVDARRSVGNTRVWSIAFSGGVNEVVVNSLSTPEDWKVDVVAADLARIWARTLEI